MEIRRRDRSERACKRCQRLIRYEPWPEQTERRGKPIDRWVNVDDGRHHRCAAPPTVDDLRTFYRMLLAKGLDPARAWFVTARRFRLGKEESAAAQVGQGTPSSGPRVGRDRDDGR